MEVSALRIDMSNGNLRTESNIGKSICHSTAFERMLKLGAHETVAISRILKDEEMDLEHEHVEDERYNN